MHHVNIPVFIPELACPFQCVFCNQQKITGYHRLPSEEEIVQIIESHLATIDLRKTQVEIAFFGGSFTGLPPDEQKRLLRIPQAYIHKGQIQGIRLSTRPDYIDTQTLDLLCEMQVTAIEIGAQSLFDEVLLKSGRGHNVEDVENASRIIRQYGFELGLQMMVGLPGDTKERAIATARKIVQLGADTSRIYPTLVIRDTALQKLFVTKQYIPLTLAEAIDIVKEIIPVFENAGVKLLKVGLHPSEGLLSGEDFVAGPFHTNFKEMVMSALWYDRIDAKLPDADINTQIQIRVPSKIFNYVIGFRAQNKRRWQNRYQSIRIVKDDKLISFPLIDHL